MKRIISLVTLIAFLTTGIGFAAEDVLRPAATTHLAPALILDDMGDANSLHHANIVRAEMALAMELSEIHNLIDIDKVTDLDVIKTAFAKNEKLKDEHSPREDTVHRPAIISYSRNIEKISAHIFTIQVSVQKNGKKDFYYLLFSTARNAHNTPFKTIWCTADELKANSSAIEAADRLPARPKDDIEAMARYRKSNKGMIHDWIKGRIEKQEFAEIEGRALALGFGDTVEFPGRINPLKSYPDGLLQELESNIATFISNCGLNVLKGPLKDRNIVFLKVPKGSRYPVISEKDPYGTDVPVEVRSHTSNHAIYIMLDAEVYNRLFTAGSRERVSIILAHIMPKIAHEMGVIYGFPYRVKGTELQNDFDLLYNIWKSGVGYSNRKLIENVKQHHPALNALLSPVDLDVLRGVNASGRHYERDYAMAWQARKKPQGPETLSVVKSVTVRWPNGATGPTFIISDGKKELRRAIPLTSADGEARNVGERLAEWLNEVVKITGFEAEWDEGYEVSLIRYFGDREAEIAISLMEMESQKIEAALYAILCARSYDECQRLIKAAGAEEKKNTARLINRDDEQPGESDMLRKKAREMWEAMLEGARVVPMADFEEATAKLDGYIDEAGAGRDTIYEYQGYEILKLLGINTPESVNIWDKDNIPPISALPIGDKLVLKIITPSQHKTILRSDDGVEGVNIVDRRDASGIIRKMFDVPTAAGVMVSSYKEKTRGLSEFLLGFTDRDAFRLFCVGEGGEDTEYRDDRAYRDYRIPFSAKEMVRATKIGREFIYSNKLPLKPEELENIIRTLTEFKLYYDLHGKYNLSTFDINPLISLLGGASSACDVKLQYSQKVETPKPRDTPERVLKLLRPDSVCVIGAIPEGLPTGHNTAMIMDNLIASFKGKLYFFFSENKHKKNSFKGREFVQEIPKDADLYIVLKGANGAKSIAADLLKQGKSVIIIAGKFGEVDEGKELEAGLKAAINEAPPEASLLGPNCMGIITPWMNAQFAGKSSGLAASPESNIAVISQSGAELASLSGTLALSGAKIKYGISIGNAVDLGLTDLLEYILEYEPEIKVVAAYIESLKDRNDGLRLLRAVEKARQKGVAVILSKGGTSPQGAIATSSHTGRKAGEYKYQKSVFEQAGAIIIEDYDLWADTICAASYFAKNGFPAGRKVFAFSSGGVEAVRMTDALEKQEFLLSPQPDEGLTGSIMELKVAQRIKSPFDVTAGADVDKIIKLLLRLDSWSGCDLILCSYLPWLYPKGGEDQEEGKKKKPGSEELLEFLSSHPFNKPLVFANKDDTPAARALNKMLRKAGYLVFTRPQRAIPALGAVLQAGSVSQGGRSQDQPALQAFANTNERNFLERAESFIKAKNGIDRLSDQQMAELKKFAGLIKDLECFRDGVKVFPEFPDGCCVLPSGQGWALLNSKGFKVSVIIRDLREAKNYIQTHYYLVVSVAGEDFIVDMVPDTFMPVHEGQSPARPEFEDAGVVIAPKTFVEDARNKNTFWMYTLGGYKEEKDGLGVDLPAANSEPPAGSVSQGGRSQLKDEEAAPKPRPDGTISKNAPARDTSLEEALAMRPSEVRENPITIGDSYAAINEGLKLIERAIVRIDDKEAIVFSEMVTFGHGLGAVLDKIAESGVKVAVIARTQGQRQAIDAINTRIQPAKNMIVCAKDIKGIKEQLGPKGFARYKYFRIKDDDKVSDGEDALNVHIFDITAQIVQRIIETLGNLCGITAGVKGTEARRDLEMARRRFIDVAA